MPPKKSLRENVTLAMDPYGQSTAASTANNGRVSMQHSRCVQVELSDMTQAVSIFSSKNEDGTIPLVIIPTARKSISQFMYVPSGCNCLLQHCGKDAGLAQPGLKWYPPWYRIAYIVSRQSSTYNAPVQQCPTADNVMVHVDCTVVFQISNPQKFVYNLGASKFDLFLSGAVEESIRVLVRSQQHDEVYQLRGNRAGNLLSLLNTKFDSCGISFTDCKITSVWLPPELSESLEATKTMEIKLQAEQKRHEYESMNINQGFERQIEKIKLENEQLRVAEEGKKKLAEMEREQALTRSNRRKAESIMMAESQSNVQKADAKNQLENAKTVFEKDKLVVLADSIREAHQIKASAEYAKNDALTKAEGGLAGMKSEAEKIELEAKVEQNAIKSLEAQRKHDLAMKEASLWSEYAARGDVRLFGRHGDSIINALETQLRGVKQVEVNQAQNCYNDFDEESEISVTNNMVNEVIDYNYGSSVLSEVESVLALVESDLE